MEWKSMKNKTCIWAGIFTLACSLNLACQETRQVVQITQPTVMAATPQATPQPNRAPIIQALSANPSHRVGPEEQISLNVKVFDPDSDTLDYTWSASKGMISATKGTFITWSPTKMDATPEEPGSAIISVIVSDNKGGQDKADINLIIADDGSAQIQSGLIAEGE
jgi:hypothetical protein